MQRLLLIAVSILFIQSVFGQKKEHIIRFKKIDPISIQNYQITEIIDKRVIKDNVGFAQKGMANRKVLAKFSKPFKKHLLNVTQKLVNSSKGDSIVLLVHDFHVSEVTKAMSESGIFRYHLEFAKRIDRKLYSLWSTEGTIEESKLEVTNSHPKRILAGIKKALVEFDNNYPKELKGKLIDINKYYRFEYWNGFKKGLYSSFIKLAKNEPFQVEGYTVKANEGEFPKYFILDLAGKKIKKGVVYFSDGIDLYMHASRYCYHNHYTKSKMIGKYIYFEDHFPEASAGLLFGAIGAAATLRGKGVILNTETGLVQELDEETFHNLASKYPDVYADYKQTKWKLADKKTAIQKINLLFKRQ